MDALALLCNLYGDGPATLKRLRVGGVLRIEDLSARPAGELATLLALTPATARRFLKEASALRLRVHDGAEVGEKIDLPRPAVRLPREVVRGKEAILDAAARRWDELERTPNAAPEREATPLAPKPAPRATPLASCEFDRATQGALEGAGVASLEALLAMDSETLALAAELGLSQVLFAQGLARRKLRDMSPPEASLNEELAVRVLHPPRRTNARFSPSDRPPAEWLSAGSDMLARDKAQATDEGAGPFA